MATMRCLTVAGAAGTGAWKRSWALTAIVLIGGCVQGQATDLARTGHTATEWNLPHGGHVRQERVAAVSDQSEVLISDDLAHVAVIDRRGRKQRVVVDGKPGPEYDEARFVEHRGPTFGPAGMPLAYAGAREGRWRLVVNGQPGPECDVLARPDALRAGPDGPCLYHRRDCAEGVRGGRRPAGADL